MTNIPFVFGLALRKEQNVDEDTAVRVKSSIHILWSRITYGGPAANCSFLLTWHFKLQKVLCESVLRYLFVTYLSEYQSDD